MRKTGKITKEVGVFTTTHEQAAAEYLMSIGLDVLFVAPIRIQYRKTADLIIEGIVWEIKTPVGNGSRTIENIIRSGKKQAQHIVLDLRFTRRFDPQCISEAQSRLQKIKKITQIFVICKNNTHMYLSRDGIIKT